MKIGAILHKIGTEDVASFLRKLEAVAGLDVVIGPDYSLMHSPDSINTRQESSDLIGHLEQISEARKGMLLVPGTMTYEAGGQIAHIAPVFLDGKLIKIFQKKSDDGEGKLAREAGKVYARGSSNQGTIDFQDRKISIGICGDWGRVLLPVGDIELILAYDRNAGFHPHLATLHIPRKTIICDGFYPSNTAVEYNPASTPQHKSLKGILERSIEVFGI